MIKNIKFPAVGGMCSLKGLIERCDFCYRDISDSLSTPKHTNRKRWKVNSMPDVRRSKQHRQRKKERDKLFFFFFFLPESAKPLHLGGKELHLHSLCNP